MALHVRTQLRRAAVALLRGLPTTADRVYRGRRRNLGADHPPSLLVYTDDEDAILASQGSPPPQDRSVMLMVECRANGAESDELEDLLDVMAAEVEPAIFDNWSFGGLASTTVLVKSRTRLEAKGDLLNGGVRLEFRVTYSTAEGRPTVAVTD
ncbi:MAG: hypothetical protein LCH93_13795 [Proteobacteria bacterium]|nr:hypothetical protein [Pseudomonadota bacterium]